MKKLFFTTTIAFLFFYNIQAQQLFFEVFSGYNLTAYDHPTYNDTQGYVPIGARIAGGLENVQVGLEYRQNITDAEFEILNDVTQEPEALHVFNEDYYGVFLRGNISSLPAYRFGLILKAGAGYYNARRDVYSVPNDVLDNEISFDYARTLGFNGGIGISAPIYTLLHWELGYQFNYIERPEYFFDGGSSVAPHKGIYHSFQLGLSLNLVFGNTAKKCRRVIYSQR